MGKITGFLEYERKAHLKRNVKERLTDWNEQTIALDVKTLQEQAARCMDCGIPFCHSGVLLRGMTSGCPLHNLIPEWNDLVYQGKWEAAYKRLAKTNPFPEFTARVCPAPCEGGCTNGLHLEPVSIKSIEYQIIETAFQNGYVKPYSGEKTNKKVAVVGSGPAGLSAAHYLSHVGHDVTVYEKSDRIGGLLMYGIPQMKLEKSTIDRRVTLLEQSGVTFITNTEVGKDIKAEDLEKEFDAVLLATGAEVPRDLHIPGRELGGVHLAMEYLTQTTKHVLDGVDFTIDAKDKNVIIIGGGDTATDCVASCIRQGATSVTQLEIMPKKEDVRDEVTNPWPEYPKTNLVDYGQKEAIHVFGDDPRNYLTTATEFTGKKGKLTSVKTVDVEWTKDKQGKFNLSFVKNSEKEYPADLVLIAIGFTGPKEEIFKAFEVKHNKRIHNPKTMTFDTSKDNVFISGDMRRGQSLVVWALQEGKLASKAIDMYLMGSSSIE